MARRSTRPGRRVRGAWLVAACALVAAGCFIISEPEYSADSGGGMATEGEPDERANTPPTDPDAGHEEHDPGLDMGSGQPAHLFSFAIIADPHISGAADHTARLDAAIEWLNTHASDRTIELVLVLGDIGWGEGLEPAKQQLDRLAVPYVPVIGDNEIAFGDEERFDTVFGPVYEALAERFEGWRRQRTPIHVPTTGEDGWLQNFSFDYKGVHFVGLDWCVRGADNALAETGDLHDFEFGTWRWLADDLTGRESEPSDSVVLASHVPMHLGFFELDEMAEIEALASRFEAQIYANLAGHVHLTYEQVVGDELFDVYVTDATFDDANTIRVIDVVGDGREFTYTHELVVID